MQGGSETRVIALVLIRSWVGSRASAPKRRDVHRTLQRLRSIYSWSMTPPPGTPPLSSSPSQSLVMIAVHRTRITLAKNHHAPHGRHAAQIHMVSRWRLRLRLHLEMDLLNMLVQSRQGGACSSGNLDNDLRHRCHRFSDHLSPYGEDTRILSCAQGARGEEGVLYFGDSGDGLDVVHLRVGMGSGILSHSNIGAHLKATCRTM